MKITGKVLAWVCLALLILYPVVAILVWGFLSPAGNHGIIAALFAANAGTALLVGLVFRLPEFRHCTSRVLRHSVVLIGVVSGFMSAIFWMADEVEHLYLRAAFVAPVVVILLMLVWFTDTVNKDRTGD